MCSDWFLQPVAVFFFKASGTLSGATGQVGWVLTFLTTTFIKTLHSTISLFSFFPGIVGGSRGALNWLTFTVTPHCATFFSVPVIPAPHTGADGNSFIN